MTGHAVTLDGNEAAASVAFRVSETVAIYPITPSSPMGEWADEWASRARANLWGVTPSVTEMQSEGGAAGAVHGALLTGSLATTFTASQGLLLMIPNMFKIAGELCPFVMHVAARSLATHALSIFGDHSDVMSARSTGFAMLASGSVQEVMDLAAVAHRATLASRVPFVHFFDGFRTSHEVTKIDELSDEDLRALMDDRMIAGHRGRALNPDRPVLRGTSQNPDVFFQSREAINPFYAACPEKVQEAMDLLAARTGRVYHLFDYFGARDAERVIVIMGSAGETVQETVEHLSARGEKVGLVKVRLFRPFQGKDLIAALPETTRAVAVLDRCKEPGSAGEPLYQDVVTALMEHATGGGNRFRAMPRIIGGRYGLSSKEFTPAMVKAVLDELSRPIVKNHFTVGIVDDVGQTSLPMDEQFIIEDPAAVRAVFYGLGSDGTVGANKNSIKMIGEETDDFVQGYFVYDSKKAGAVTVSHLRFGKKPIRSAYLVQQPSFVACHHQDLLDRFPMLEAVAPGAMFLLNSGYPREQVWDSLPREVQQQLIAKRMKFFVINASRVARETGMGLRINTIMQACFFAVSGVLPRDEAIAGIKAAIRKSYSLKGESVVIRNFQAVDAALDHLFEVPVPARVSVARGRPAVVPAEAPEFVREVTAAMLAGEGDRLPVSRLPADGVFPTNTARWEKRNLAYEIPVWDSETCIQCNKCALVCPHAAIRANVYPESCLAEAPASFLSTPARGPEFKGLRYTLQVAPEDCTGCGLCVEICPAKNKRETRLKAINMVEQRPIRERERTNYRFFLDLPEFDRAQLKANTVKGSQFMLPLFEYSGACVGCGETPYVKLVSQLFGDRAVIANATGCSSIYGGNLPTTPWAQNREGRGPAWCNSLFEDNAEFGLGYRLSLDHQEAFAGSLLLRLAGHLGKESVEALLSADQADEAGVRAQRHRVAELKEKLMRMDTPEAFNLLHVADALCRRSVWIIGGDGWAYDIGYGGLDHVLASRRNVNILVLDTEVYSNTGGQMSKSTPRGAVAKFAAGGKGGGKKDLGLLAMSYGHVYVAQVAMGANDNQTVRAFTEAERYDGPSLIIAYSHCIAHGINMRMGLHQQKLAVDCGHWMLYRFDPRRTREGLNPLQLDSHEPSVPFRKYIEGENRYRILEFSDPARARELLEQAQADAHERYRHYARLAESWESAAPEAPVMAGA